MAAQIRQQTERLENLEKQVKDLASEKHLTEILLKHSQPQVILLEAEPKPAPVPSGLEHVTAWTSLRPDSFLPEHLRKLIQEHPGMLFHASVPNWQVGFTLDKSRLVFVPDVIYRPYEQECLQAVGWSPEQELENEESISVENDETGEVENWPNPVQRLGVWKARQVAHWTGEEDCTQELNYNVWANGMWG